MLSLDLAYGKIFQGGGVSTKHGEGLIPTRLSRQVAFWVTFIWTHMMSKGGNFCLALCT